MPKARKRGKTQTQRPAVQTASEQSGAARVATVNRRQSPQSLLMDGMVALGCWGMAVSFAFFSNQANRWLFAGMCALMAAMWSFRFGMRLLKVRQQAVRQRSIS
jgi:hypothetical protein